LCQENCCRDEGFLIGKNDKMFVKKLNYNSYIHKDSGDVSIFEYLDINNQENMKEIAKFIDMICS
jgi:hypothetical protein